MDTPKMSWIFMDFHMMDFRAPQGVTGPVVHGSFWTQVQPFELMIVMKTP